jgi:peptidyl-prolyl cis-trans isomerase A (cyclophilin A)
MNTNFLKASAVAISLIALSACKKEAPAPETTTNEPKTITAVPMDETAPETFKVRFETTKGPIVVEAHRSWSPLGVDRFYTLVNSGYYDGTRFFRVVKGFMAQFGINGDPKLSTAWRERRIADDPPKESNLRGRVTFGNAGPNTRTTQLFINFKDNQFLDTNYTPIGEVVEGMDVVDALNGEYGEGAPQGNGPDQGRIFMEGETYLARDFAKLDKVTKATIVK